MPGWLRDSLAGGPLSDRLDTRDVRRPPDPRLGTGALPVSDRHRKARELSGGWLAPSDSGSVETQRALAVWSDGRTSPPGTVDVVDASTLYLRELLDQQLAYLLEQRGREALLSVPSFLGAIRRESQIAIHVDDLRAEAQRLGESLRAAEYDEGNPGQLLELTHEELRQKVPQGPVFNTLLRGSQSFSSLLGDFDHPFTLSLLTASDEPMGRVNQLLAMVTEAAQVTSIPILQFEAGGFQAMVARNTRVQRTARLRTHGEPAVALLRLEAIENFIFTDQAHADSRTEGSTPALRVQIDSQSVRVMRAAIDGSMLAPEDESHLDLLADEVHRAAKRVVLEVGRRLYSARSRVGVLLRFKARCEWHDRERLRRRADDASAAGEKPEHVLRDELNRYLFDQGLNPIAEAVLGTSSRADVFDPSRGPAFYIEAKQYADRAGLESQVRQAFRQALDTVGNLPGSGYSADEAFVVLFRRGGPRAILPVEPFSADGLRWHFVLINIADATRDASQNRETPEEYTAGRLRGILLEVRDKSR